MTTRKRPHASGFFWVAIWLLPLLGPLGTVGESARPAWLAGGGLGAFALGYVLVVWLSFEDVGTLRAQAVGYVVMLALGLALAIGYGPTWLQVMLYAINAAAAVFAGYHHLLKFTVVLGLALAAVTVAIGLAWHAPVGVVVSAAGGGLLSGALVFVVRQMSRLIRELQETRDQLAVVAVAEERLRFSRDLHDLLGHTLSVIVVKAEVVRRLVERDPEAAATQAKEIEEVGRQALVEIREAVTGYRETGLTAELSRARSALSTAGVETTMRRTADPLPGPTDALLAFVVREAVTNVVRHSGARRCVISLGTLDKAVTLEIRDDGSAPPAPPGNGLTGMTERVARAGGALAAGPCDEGGFVVKATIPLVTA
jgi:two-component system sensor histidine kinase DesK